jgi:hypothetical protein
MIFVAEKLAAFSAQRRHRGSIGLKIRQQVSSGRWWVQIGVQNCPKNAVYGQSAGGPIEIIDDFGYG